MDVVSLIREEQAGRHRPLAGALLTAIFELCDLQEELRFRAGLCALADESAQPRAKCNYGNLLFVEEWVPFNCLLDRLDEMLNGRISICGCEATFPFSNASEARPRRADRREFAWPSLTIRCHCSGSYQNVSRDAPVVAFGLPPYRTQDDAIRAWLFAEPYRNRQPAPNAGELLIVVPDTRGRIVSVSWTDETISAELDVNVALDSVEIQLVFSLPDREERSSSRITGRRVQCQVPEGTQSLSLYLVQSPFELLDYLEVSEFRARPTQGELSGLQEQAAKDISAGEGEEVEFKPFIRIGDDEKWNEVIKTIVAFANTRGGRIYVGVRDDATPEGESRLCSAGKGDRKAAGEALQQYIRKLITERIKRAPGRKIDLIDLHGSPVIVLSIARTARPYCATHQNDVYIRKGATNRRPDPNTEFRPSR
jgi:hypothetical protein